MLPAITTRRRPPGSRSLIRLPTPIAPSSYLPARRGHPEVADRPDGELGCAVTPLGGDLVLAVGQRGASRQELVDAVEWEWLGEVVALAEVAVQVEQLLELVGA